MKERDQWDKHIGILLEGYEADPHPDDWQAIAARLPRAARAVWWPAVWRTVAAAAIVLLLGGSWWLFFRTTTDVVLTAETAPASPPQPAGIDLPPSAAVRTVEMPTVQPPHYRTASPQHPKTVVRRTEAHPLLAAQKVYLHVAPVAAPNLSVQLQQADAHRLTADATAAGPSSPSKPLRTRRWSIGMGGIGGGVSTGGEAAPLLQVSDMASLPQNYTANDKHIAEVNSQLNRTDRMDVKHRQPISFGLGVSYALTDRWSLYSGINYTQLRSEWRTASSVSTGHTRQRLHFVGIPVGVNYRLAQWRRFTLYASAGTMAEWNVAGHLSSDLHSGNGPAGSVSHRREPIATTPMQWSLNARAGVSYPLLRFVGLYAEAGTAYYIPNGSPVETIRSKHPVQMSLQAGVRLGF